MSRWNSGTSDPAVHPSARAGERPIRRVVGLAIAAVATLAVGIAPAYAATTGGVALYISGPLVQGAEIQPTGTLTEDFNSLGGSPTLNGVACPTNLAVVKEVGGLTITPNATTDCLYRTPGIYGGASVTTPEPAFGGPGSNYFGTSPTNSSAAITFTFDAPVKYVGFWWSGGNAGNRVAFYNGATEIASLETSQLETLLGATPPNPWPGDGTVTSIGGTPYPKGYYFGNPRGFTAYPPTGPSGKVEQAGLSEADKTAHQCCIYAYLNLFLTGDQSATSVVFSGRGFEFDNLTTSTLAQTPVRSLVFVGGLAGKTVQFLPGAADATGSMVAQSAPVNTTAALSPNAYQRTGFVFDGWNTQQDGLGVRYADGASYGFAGDLTLYAQWRVAPPPGSSSGSGAIATTQVGELAATGGPSPWGMLFATGLVIAGSLALLSARARGVLRQASPSSRS